MPALPWFELKNNFSASCCHEKQITNFARLHLPVCTGTRVCRFFLFPVFCRKYHRRLGTQWRARSGGYIVYRNIGSPGPPYKYSDDLPEEDLANPLNPMLTITGLQKNTKYYVAVTAYDTDGNESRYSDDVCVQIINSALSVCSSSISSHINAVVIVSTRGAVMNFVARNVGFRAFVPAYSNIGRMAVVWSKVQGTRYKEQ